MNTYLRHCMLTRMACLFVLFGFANAKAQQNIDSLEYAVDNIAGFGLAANKIAVTNAPVVTNFPFNVNIGAVSNGVHTLLVRTHSKTTSGLSGGYWSEVNYTYFYKQSTLSTTASNIQKLEYFIDTDPGEGNAIAISVVPGVQVSGVSFNPNIGALGNGFHIIYIRSLDQNGKWSITNSTYFYKQNNVPTIVSNAKKLEYFIDNDPGEGNATAINVTPAIQVSGITFNPNIGALGIGFHVLFIRSLDLNGKWSITNYQYFYKQNTVSVPVSSVSKMEYFIDTDPGEGQGSAIAFTPGTNVSGISFNAAIGAISTGFHVIFIRSLDANGKWGITNYAYFSKAGPQLATPVNIVKIEYYIDTDPGYFLAHDVSITPAQDIANKSFAPSMAGLAAGLHYLNVRSLDSRGKWSLNAKDSFRILSPLPITLLNFSASPSGSAVNLAWQTSYEQNLVSFSIEHSVDGVTFSSIGNVTPANNRLGSAYLFKDLSPGQGINYYRLKIFEVGGFHYSVIRLVNFTGGKSLLSVFPDPADKFVTVKTELSNYTIELITADGKIIKTLKGNNNAAVINVSDVPTGLYTMRGISGEVVTSTLVIIKH